MVERFLVAVRMILRCTQKFLDFIRVAKKDISVVPADAAQTLHDWHAHLFYLNRQKHVLFSHSTSLFFVVAFNVFKKDMIDLGSFFTKNLARCLYYEEFKADEINRIVGAVKETDLSLTNNRRVLGSMNDLIKQYKCVIDWREPSESELPEFQKGLNKTPMSMLKYNYPIERFRQCALEGLVTGVKAQSLIPTILSESRAAITQVVHTGHMGNSLYRRHSQAYVKIRI